MTTLNETVIDNIITVCTAFISGSVFGQPFVKLFTLCYQTIVSLSCPVCNVGVLWPNGWMDQNEIWHAARPRPWPHCVRWGPISPFLTGDRALPIFRPYLLWPNGHSHPSQLLLSSCYVIGCVTCACCILWLLGSLHSTVIQQNN